MSVTRFREDIVEHGSDREDGSNGSPWFDVPLAAMRGQMEPAVATSEDPSPRSHPRLLETPRRLTGPLPGPPRTAAVRELAVEVRVLASLRHFVTEWASAQRLAREAVEELVLAVNELASNSIRHGGGRGTLRVWRDAHDLVCEVQDSGHIEDPLVGRKRPAPDCSSGRGLWMVDHLCDEVQIRSSRAGTVVRVRKRLH